MNERFPHQTNAKLSPKVDGPFQVVQMINDNNFKIELSGSYDIFTTFNVVNLSPNYDKDDY